MHLSPLPYFDIDVLYQKTTLATMVISLCGEFIGSDKNQHQGEESPSSAKDSLKESLERQLLCHHEGGRESDRRISFKPTRKPTEILRFLAKAQNDKLISLVR
ncbi:hypothetical protein [Helicobacter marmotae]|uniref:Uncharacterized protein n=1 Tax=Helicobacter marmotae TaxID=152490 RepID=A0A3D8I5H7_9HELI|nr:hypothetical protein [Helicobacter marmotae]RDU60420.1 hypothetical protein CQA63_02355 [Helicobacter marmotae]